MQETHLEGRVAVVTGGSRGIGLATAEALVSKGADVVICGRSEASLSEAIEQIAGRPGAAGPGRAEAFQADVRDPSQMIGLMERAVERLGRLDILINSAGIGRFANVTDLTVADWQAVIGTNLSGVFLACHAAVPHLRRSGGGWIINISSLAGPHPFVGGSAYCASKAGLDALSEVLMQELRHDDIRVSCVAPGSVDTRFGASGDSEAPWKLSVVDVARAVIDLLGHQPRSLPSRVEIRPTRPKK